MTLAKSQFSELGTYEQTVQVTQKALLLLDLSINDDGKSFVIFPAV